MIPAAVGLGLSAAQLGFGMYQTIKASKENARLASEARELEERDRKEAIGYANREEALARSVAASPTTLTAESIKETGKQAASNAISTASFTGARSEDIKGSIGRAAREGRQSNIDALEVNEAERLRGDALLKDSFRNSASVRAGVNTRVYDLMLRQQAGNTQLQQAGIFNLFAGAQTAAGFGLEALGKKAGAGTTGATNTAKVGTTGIGTTSFKPKTRNPFSFLRSG